MSSRATASAYRYATELHLGAGKPHKPGRGAIRQMLGNALGDMNAERHPRPFLLSRAERSRLQGDYKTCRYFLELHRHWRTYQRMQAA